MRARYERGCAAGGVGRAGIGAGAAPDLAGDDQRTEVAFGLVVGAGCQLRVIVTVHGDFESSTRSPTEGSAVRAAELLAQLG